MRTLESISIIYRAAQVRASLETGSANKNIDAITNLSEFLYGNEPVPFRLNEDMLLPMHLMSPRLRSMLESDILKSRKLWAFLSARENVIRMITATEMGKTAAEAMSYRIEAFYDGKPDNKSLVQFKQTIGYMIKIIMELFGYVVKQKRVKIASHKRPDNGKDLKYFTTASRYLKINQAFINELLLLIEDPREKKHFEYICGLITADQALYQKQYALDALTASEVL